MFSCDAPYSVQFPQNSLFLVPPHIFGSTCYVRDVWPSLTKLDPKNLKCGFLGNSRRPKRYLCYFPNLNRYLVPTDVTFSETIPF